MTTTPDGPVKGHDGIEPRTKRALRECMTVLPLGGDVYSVTTESGSEYRVDARDGRCTCSDHQHRDVRCKHLRRVALAEGRRPVPEQLLTVADDLLGAHADGPRVVAADGGAVADEPTPVDSAGDEYDVGCAECVRRSDGTLVGPCFPCYSDGVGFPDDQ